jgi:hypothetical protein
VYGDTTWRGNCPTETAEQSTFFNQLPPDLKKIALHIRNEGKRSHAQLAKIKAEGGFVSGAPDIFIPGQTTFICELKRQDHTKSKWQPGQLDYLEAAMEAGCFVCAALGWQAAMEAVKAWRDQ